MKFIGVYLSYKEDCKLCLQIDDDNFIVEKDYLGEAKKILQKNKITLLKSTNGWSNIYHYVKKEIILTYTQEHILGLKDFRKITT